jgi:hypothetical protein
MVDLGGKRQARRMSLPSRLPSPARSGLGVTGAGPGPDRNGRSAGGPAQGRNGRSRRPLVDAVTGRPSCYGLGTIRFRAGTTTPAGSAALR